MSNGENPPRFAEVITSAGLGSAAISYSRLLID